mgnify:CR=1 FL=1
MKLLRRYIRNTLLEAFNTPNPGGIHDRLAFIRAPHEQGGGGYVYVMLDPELVEHALKNVEMRGITHHADANAVVLSDCILGMMRIDESALDCNGAYTIDSVAADGGLGPTMYDIVAMDPDLIGGIIADRHSVRPKARDIWQYYYKIKKSSIDNNYKF